jgi:hypothetical protein
MYMRQTKASDKLPLDCRVYYLTCCTRMLLSCYSMFCVGTANGDLLKYDRSSSMRSIEQSIN